MSSRRDGAKLTTLLRRVLLGDRPSYEDAEFEAALDSALNRANEHERRLAALQDRLDVLGRMRR